MSEQGTDRYGAEYKRTNNDFRVRYLEQDNGICSVCHGTGAKIEIRYVVRNYESARVKKKICKNLQAHERSIWICPKCINNFKQKISVLKTLPSAHSEIVRCKDCKHWVKTVGYKQWSLGDCSFLEKHFVMCNGFCAWAERRTDE